MSETKGLSYLIDKIVASDLFQEANYYFRSMKKQPHGGVAHIYYPNAYLKHYAADTFWLFTYERESIPYFLLALVEETYQEYLKCEIDIEELCWLCFDDNNFWYVGFCLLKPKREYETINKSIPILWSVISSKLRFQDYFEFDDKLLVYALICYLIKSKMIEIEGITEICRHEVLRVPHKKYGLSPVNEAKFLRQGFIIDDRYYLYNIFFDTSIGAAIDDVPYAIKIINEEIPKSKLFLRCDEKVRDNFVITNYVHAQYYPAKKVFNHIDFSANQYSKDTFEKSTEIEKSTEML